MTTKYYVPAGYYHNGKSKPAREITIVNKGSVFSRIKYIDTSKEETVVNYCITSSDK